MEESILEIQRILHQNMTMPKSFLISLELLEIGGPSLLLIGSVLNLLAFMIFINPRNCYHSSFIFLAALSCTDLVGLWTSFASQWLLRQYDVHVETYSITGCKFHVFLVHVSLQFSSCLLVALSTERLIAVMFPGRVKTVCSPWNTCIIITEVFSMLILLNIHVFKDYTVRKYIYDNATYMFTCEKIKYSDIDVSRYDFWYWINFCLITIIPAVYLSIANFVLIVNLSKMKSKQEVQGVNPSIKSKFASKMNDSLQLNFMVIWLNFWFIIGTTPSRLYTILTENEDLTKKMGSKMILGAIFFLLPYASNILYFIIYFLSFSKFRKDVAELLVERPLNWISQKQRHH